MEESKIILKKYWGHEHFRSPQQEIISTVLDRKDTIALLPTGGGKSICFQIPALIFKGKTLVVSPLIALMDDQVNGLVSRGIAAKCLHSNLNIKQIDQLLDNFVYGDLKILYISPERITSEMFSLRLAKTKLDLIAVDEAHCISQWGYDFRPAYFNIVKLREIHPKVPIIALTATATDKVIDDIKEKLELKNPVLFKKSFTRENLGITIIHSENKRSELVQILNKVKGCSIIYVRNRKETIEVAQWLSQYGFTSVSYHGGMERSVRERNQNVWMTNQVRLMVATNAFGMGIDKPDVRLVVHLDIPPSLEEYYQEAGRAGRDGKESFAVSIIDNSDIKNAKTNFEDQYPELDFIEMVYDKLCRYLKVAYGAGFNETYDFSILDFSDYLEMPIKKIYHTLNVIEKEGWICFSEAYKEASRLMIVVSHHDLVFNDPKGELKTRIITHLLRKYEGLFMDPVKIDETRVAQELQIEEIQLVYYLNLLQAEGIIYYKPKSSSPQVTFLEARPGLNSFSIDKASYFQRKKMAKDRLDSVIVFVNNENECRQGSIIAYFGEHFTQCGKCDICLGSMDIKLTEEQTKQVFDHLKNSLSTRVIDVKTYVSIYPFNKRRRIVHVLKSFESERLISIDDGGYISIIRER